jgi:hypothetical protein
MALESIDILVLSDEIIPVVVDGVVVRVFDDTGTTFITDGVTGFPSLPGHVLFTLNGSASPGTTYQLRLYINGGSIPSPQYIAVYSPPGSSPTGTNNFQVDAHLFTLPEATDLRLCRASGFFKTGAGRARRGLDMHFIPQFSPLVVEGVGVLGERVAVRTDKTGYVEIDLYRTGIYQVTAEGLEDIQREKIVVPDQPAVNINHLLFPIVTAISYVPAGPWTVAVGGSLDIIPTPTATNAQQLLPPADEDLEYKVTDTAIASVNVSSTGITIRGVAVGSTTLKVTRRDTSIVYIPDPGITGNTVTINVI